MTFKKPPAEEMLRQAQIELSELRASVEYDEEFMEGVLTSILPLEQAVQELLEDPEHGASRYQGRDLPFMDLVRRLDRSLLPFRQLFIDINNAHLEKDQASSS